MSAPRLPRLKLAAATILPAIVGTLVSHGIVRYWPTGDPARPAAHENAVVPSTLSRPETAEIPIPPGLNAWEGLLAAAATLNQAERRQEIERLLKEDEIIYPKGIRTMLDHRRVRFWQYRALLQPEDLPWIREEFRKSDRPWTHGSFNHALAETWAEWDTADFEASVKKEDFNDVDTAYEALAQVLLKTMSPLAVWDRLAQLQPGYELDSRLCDGIGALIVLAARENPQAALRNASGESRERQRYEAVNIVLGVIAERNLLEALKAAQDLASDESQGRTEYDSYLSNYIDEAVTRGEAAKICEYTLAMEDKDFIRSSVFGEWRRKSPQEADAWLAQQDERIREELGTPEPKSDPPQGTLTEKLAQAHQIVDPDVRDTEVAITIYGHVRKNAGEALEMFQKESPAFQESHVKEIVEIIAKYDPTVIEKQFGKFSPGATKIAAITLGHEWMIYNPVRARKWIENESGLSPVEQQEAFTVIAQEEKH